MLIVGILARKQFGNRTADPGLIFATRKMKHALIDAKDAAFLVVNEDGIANGVKRVCPLPLNRVHLLKKKDVLHREAEQVGNIFKVIDLVILNFGVLPAAHCKNPERRIFCAKHERDDLAYTGGEHAITFQLVGFVDNLHGAEFFMKYALSPGLAGGNFLVPGQIVFVEAYGGMHDQLRRIPVTLQKPHHAMRNAQTANDVNQHQVQNFAYRKSLCAGGSQQAEAAEFVV